MRGREHGLYIKQEAIQVREKKWFGKKNGLSRENALNSLTGHAQIKLNLGTKLVSSRMSMKGR